MTTRDDIARIVHAYTCGCPDGETPGATATAIAGEIMPLVRRAQAEALREAHADIQAYTDSGAPFGHRPVEEFLLQRADRIEKEESNG